MTHVSAWRTLGGALTVVVLMAGGAAAQSQTNARMRGLDRNGDGVITRDEWRGSARSFEVHDWNDDGVLSGDEIADDSRPPSPRGPVGRAGTAEESWRQVFDALDRDGDGRISRAEWNADPGAFQRSDADRDGYVNRSEFAAVGNDRATLFALMDRNRDGRLTRDEWREAPGTFDWLDRNGDGVLTRDEAVGSGGSTAADSFADLDANGDQVISREEWPESQSSFATVDANRNGAITRDEWNARAQALRTSQSRAYRAGYDRGLAEGRQAGREDKAINNWDLAGQRELEQADSGYTPGLGSRTDYQAGYRAGFKAGYAEGFGPRS